MVSGLQTADGILRKVLEVPLVSAAEYIVVQSLSKSERSTVELWAYVYGKIVRDGSLLSSAEWCYPSDLKVAAKTPV